MWLTHYLKLAIKNMVYVQYKNVLYLFKVQNLTYNLNNNLNLNRSECAMGSFQNVDSKHEGGNQMGEPVHTVPAGYWWW